MAENQCACISKGVKIIWFLVCLSSGLASLAQLNMRNNGLPVGLVRIEKGNSLQGDVVLMEIKKGN